MKVTFLERTGLNGTPRECAGHPGAVRDITAAVRRWNIGDIASLNLIATDLPGTTWFDARIVTTDRVIHYAHHSEMGWVLTR